MINLNAFRFIEDENKLQYLSDTVKNVTDGEYLISLEFVNKNNWAAIPIAAPLDENDVKRISKAANSYGYKTGVAITTENISVGTEETGYKFAAFDIKFQKKSLYAISSTWTMCPFLYFPEDLGFLILNEGDYYCIIAGKEDFVENVIGKTLKDMKNELTLFRSDYEDELIEVFDYYNHKSRANQSGHSP